VQNPPGWLYTAPPPLSQGASCPLAWCTLELATMGTDGGDALALEYLRRQYQNIFDWYKSADSKSQVLLGVNGAVISIVGVVFLAAPSELAARLSAMSSGALYLICAASLCLVTSVTCGVFAVRARLSNTSMRRIQQEMHINPDNPATFGPEGMWWFGFIGQMVGSPISQRETFLRRKALIETFLMENATPGFEVQALASQIIILASNTLAKFRWVNRGWILYSSGLALLLIFIAIYVLEIRA
jgi:hypothetical protein